jgi:hypothetical protein
MPWENFFFFLGEFLWDRPQVAGLHQLIQTFRLAASIPEISILRVPHENCVPGCGAGGDQAARDDQCNCQQQPYATPYCDEPFPVHRTPGAAVCAIAFVLHAIE